MTDAEKIHQLEQRLADCQGESRADRREQIDILNDLAWALSDTDMHRAYALAETAHALAGSPDDGAPPYEAGMAYSRRTQGYLNQRWGDYPRGLSQLLEALTLFETLKLDDGLPDVYDGLAGIYGQIGSFPEALDIMYKQLEVAERIGDKRRIANANNNLAHIYMETHNYQRAEETLLRNLELAAESGYERIECLSHLNLAETYLSTGNHELAREHGWQGLRISEEAGFALFEAYALEILGKASAKSGDAPQAIDYLEQALAASRTVGSRVTESLILLDLGRVYRDNQALDTALDTLQQGLAVAHSINARSEVFNAYLLLSEVYEQMGDAAQALAHFKQYQAFKELVAGERADQRLKVLQVAYDTETARREAAIERLRTVELQQEVVEHRQAGSQLQRQLDYVQALSRCSQTLLLAAGDEAGQRHLLNQALEHLRVGSHASRAYVFRNLQDAALGPCLGILAEACAPDVKPHLTHSRNQRAPWSLMPSAVFDALQAGQPIGGPTETLFADSTILLEEFRRQVPPLLSAHMFPIFVNDEWMGFVGFDECHYIRHWGEQEIMLLGTASEMFASALQRWEAEAALRSLNDRLEQDVAARTVELSHAVVTLQREVEERQRAERALQEMAESLDNRLIARTEELAAFFDLTLLASQSLNLVDVFEQVMPRILEATRSRAVCVHLLDAGRTALHLTAQQNITQEVKEHLQRVEPPPALQHWLEEPNHPLVVAPFASDMSIPASLRIPGYQSYLGAQIRIGQQTEGILSCFRFTDRGFSVDEIAVVTALAEQMGMMLETDRLRQNARTLAVSEERQRLARDLHDSVTQSLYSLSLFSRAGREAAEDGDTERLIDNLSQMERNTLLALREMRLLLYELRPADLEQEGLKRAVELRLNAVERRVGLRLDAQIDDLPGLAPSQEIELYHIIVEALNNVAKHAAASHLALHLTQSNGAVHLLIADDGQGFDQSQQNGGLGLRNIRERVNRLNGRLAMASEPGRGTQLEAAIPCGKEVD